MIPIFPFFSISLALGLLGVLFPGMFPVAGSMARVGGLAALGTYRRIRNFTQALVIYGATALTIWFSLLLFAIYLRRWEFAIVGMVSTGVAFLAAAILLFTAKHVAHAVVSNLKLKASALSGAIKLLTIPWDRQPLWMKFASLAASPLYGLYLLVMLPTKGMLELVVAAADFIVWMQRIVVISAAVSVCSWFLTGLVIFQLQFNLTGPLDLFTLSVALLFVATLISLLLMMGSPMVKVLEFIQMLGFLNLALITFCALDHFRPDICDPMLRAFTGRWAGLVANVIAHPALAMILMVGLSALVCLMPWCRSFAGPISLGLLLLWVVGTNFATPFYTELEWWIGLVGLAACWLYLRSWKIPTPATATPTPAATPAPATPAAPAAPAATGHAPAAAGAAAPASTSKIPAIIAAGVAILAFAAVGMLVTFVTGNASGLHFTGTHGVILLATLFVACVIGLFATAQGGGSHGGH